MKFDLAGRPTHPRGPMSGCVKGKGRGVARNAQMGRAHPYKISRNVVIRGTHSSENRGLEWGTRVLGHCGDDPIVGIVVTFVPENGLTSTPCEGSGYRLVSGRQRPNRLVVTANNGGHEGGKCSLKNLDGSYKAVSASVDIPRCRPEATGRRPCRGSAAQACFSLLPGACARAHSASAAARLSACPDSASKILTPND